VERGPLFTHLQARHGGPLGCEAAADGGALRLTYAFAAGCTLGIRRDPRIEYTDTRVVVDGLTRDEALTLLHAQERAQLGGDGCGIEWSRPPQQEPAEDAAGEEEVFRGDACNCQARLLVRGAVVVRLVFRSAC